MRRKILISGVNWLGDSVMCMPAMQVFRKKNPDWAVTMMVKKGLIPLWKMHSAVDATIEIRENFSGTSDTVRDVRAGGFTEAYIFPNSFRSALIPYMAGIKRRRGFPGHSRAWMINEIVSPARSGPNRHQMLEYLDILGVDMDPLSPEAPALNVPQDLQASWKDRLKCGAERRCAGMIPGAAFGESKRWPASLFADVCRMIAGAGDTRIILFGAESERKLCGEIAAEADCGALNMAGETSLADFAALLRLCAVVITNDNGGMHLAAAVGTPVIAVFGITDPAKTGPLGQGHVILAGKTVARSRDIKHRSGEATDALCMVKPEQVYEEYCRKIRALCA